MENIFGRKLKDFYKFLEIVCQRCGRKVFSPPTITISEPNNGNLDEMLASILKQKLGCNCTREALSVKVLGKSPLVLHFEGKCNIRCVQSFEIGDCTIDYVSSLNEKGSQMFSQFVAQRKLHHNAHDSFLQINNEVEMSCKVLILSFRSVKNSSILKTSLERRLINSDSETCWLNSCLQMLLNGFDHLGEVSMTSPIGKKLLEYQKMTVVDPKDMKQMLQNLINQNPGSLDIDSIISGQQCARDFFVILTGNLNNCEDVFDKFKHTLIQTMTCLHCKRTTSNYTNRQIIQI